MEARPIKRNETMSNFIVTCQVSVDRAQDYVRKYSRKPMFSLIIIPVHVYTEDDGTWSIYSKFYYDHLFYQLYVK